MFFFTGPVEGTHNPELWPRRGPVRPEAKLRKRKLHKEFFPDWDPRSRHVFGGAPLRPETKMRQFTGSYGNCFPGGGRDPEACLRRGPVRLEVNMRRSHMRNTAEPPMGQAEPPTASGEPLMAPMGSAKPPMASAEPRAGSAEPPMASCSGGAAHGVSGRPWVRRIACWVDGPYFFVCVGDRNSTAPLYLTVVPRPGLGDFLLSARRLWVGDAWQRAPSMLTGDRAAVTCVVGVVIPCLLDPSHIFSAGANSQGLVGSGGASGKDGAPVTLGSTDVC